MKRYLIILLAIGALSLLTSCTVTRYVAMGETYEKEFIGMEKEYVEYVCGEPSKVDCFESETVITYDDMAAFGEKTGYDLKKEAKSNGVVENGYVQFFFNSSGVCYSVRTNHTTPVKEVDNTRTWMAIAGSGVGVSLLSAVASFFLSLML